MQPSSFRVASSSEMAIFSLDFAVVARCLATLLNPVLYPGLSPQLALPQEAIGYLTGVSRLRVNRSLKVLQFAG